jgi:alkylhydroperoxidase family enzyme
MLLHSPALAAGWNAYLGAVRNQLSLDPLLRELAMCAVASLNGAEYEFIHHAPVFVAAGGTAAQVEALRHPDTARADVSRFLVALGVEPEA